MKKYPLIFLLILTFFALNIQSAFADISQLNYSQVVASGQGGAFTQNLGTALSGTSTSVDLYVGGQTGSPFYYPYIDIQECNAGYTGCSYKISGFFRTSNTGNILHYNYADFALNNTKYYRLVITWSLGYAQNIDIYGYNSQAYYVMFGAVYTEPSTSIISVVPASNATVIPFVATSTDRFADFDVDLLTYYNNATVNSIAVISTTLKNNIIPSYNYGKSQISGFGSGLSTTSYNIAQNVPFGNYDYTIIFLDSSLNIISATTSSNITFGSSTNAITFADVYGASSSDMFDIGQIATSSTCSITDITGCFKNAMVWAFYPSQSSLEGYTTFLGLIQTKAPIGYFFTIKTAITGISTSSTSAFNIIIPAHLKTYIFTPVDIGIASILWIYFIFMFYKRLKHIQI